jgi:hypothetical protein
LEIDVSPDLEHDRADSGLKPKEAKRNVRSVKGLIVDNLERGMARVKSVDERFWLVGVLKTEAELGSALIGVELVRQRLWGVGVNVNNERSSVNIQSACHKVFDGERVVLVEGHQALAVDGL